MKYKNKKSLLFFAGMMLMSGVFFLVADPASADLAAGLRIHYSMDAADVSGATLRDKSGNNIDATITGAAVIGGRINEALYFNGATNYTIANYNKNNFSNLSISMWMRPTGSQSTVGVFQWANGLNTTSPWLLLQRTTTGVRWYIDGNYRITLSTPANDWTHLVLTRSSTSNTWTAYLNGVSAGSYTGTPASTNGTNLYFGNGYNGYFQGFIDEVKVYDRVISGAEIAALFNEEPASAGISTGLVGHWKLDEADAPFLDSSGNGNDGTNTGATCGVNWVKGTGCQFDGVAAADNNISINDPGTGSVFDFVNNSHITLSAWANASLFDKDYNTILFKGINYGIRFRRVNNLSAKFVFTFKTGGTWREYNTASTLQANSPTHIAVSYTFGDANSIKVYFNGVLQTGSWVVPTGNEAPTVGNDVFKIGDLNGEEWNGIIDDVRIYNRILPAADIQTLFNTSIATVLEAGESDLHKWAWAGDAVGWVSLNGADTGGGQNYQVFIDNTDGRAVGFAWSENIGWIDFGFGNCVESAMPPSGKYGAFTCVAPDGGSNGVSLSGSALSGWARIVSIATASAVNNSGGWQGWIKLSGANYGVTVAGNAMAGYAWSDELGWINFNGVTITTPPQLKICGATVLTDEDQQSQLDVYKWDALAGVASCGDTSLASNITPSCSWSSSKPSTVAMGGTAGEINKGTSFGNATISAACPDGLLATQANYLKINNCFVCNAAADYTCSPRIDLGASCLADAHATAEICDNFCQKPNDYNWREIKP